MSLSLEQDLAIVKHTAFLRQLGETLTRMANFPNDLVNPEVRECLQDVVRVMDMCATSLLVETRD